MAADFIVVNRSKQHGNRAVRIADLLVELRSIIDAEFSSANHMFEASDYSVLEAQFGLAAGTGANYLNLLGLMREVLNSTDEIPGASRKAWLDEYAARIAGQ
jgi:hypothetical protein